MRIKQPFRLARERELPISLTDLQKQGDSLSPVAGIRRTTGQLPQGRRQEGWRLSCSIEEARELRGMGKRTAGAVRFVFVLRLCCVYVLLAFCVLRFAFVFYLRFAFVLRLRSACGLVMGCPRHDHSSSGVTGAVPLTAGVSGELVSGASSRTLPR